jgi:hypothetical protein
VALDTILRGASGYVAAPRPSGTVGASVYDRIIVMPASVQALGRPVSMPPPFPQPPPANQPPEEPASDTLSFNPPIPGDRDAEAYQPPEEVLMPGATDETEIAQPFAPGQDGDPLVPGEFGTVSPPAGGSPWSVPAGSSRPGMISTPQPQEPNNPQPPPLEPQ